MRPHFAAIATATLVGTAPALGEGRVVITEIMYNPASDESNAQTEWVEIANVGDEAVEIKNWRLDDEDRGDWAAFSCTLEPGGIAVLVNAGAVNEAAFREAWDPEPSADGDGDEDKAAAAAPAYQVIAVRWASLANSPDADNEILKLIDGEQKVICEVNIQEGGDWPQIGRNDGPSIYLTDLTAESLNDGKLWKASVAETDGARKNRKAKVFDGVDIGSPGFVPGLKAKKEGNKIDY